MKKIKELHKQLNSTKPFALKYPEFNLKDNKVHVLFVSAFINGTGYYRSILPMLELNKTTTHSAITASLHKWSFSKQFEDYDNPIDKRLIEWADYIVLPTLFSDVKYIINAIKSINNDVQFVMDIDYNYHAYPKHHPNRNKISKLQLNTLLDNMQQVDVLTGATEALLVGYDSLLLDRYPNTSTYMIHQPNFVSEVGMETIEVIHKNKSNTIKIGVVGEYSNHRDLLSIKEVLLAIEKHYKEHVEFVFFGWDGRLKDQEDLKLLKRTYQKSVSFLNYYNTLNDLNLDMALLPLEDNAYNRCKSAVKAMELSSLAIPVIASHLPPYSEHIMHEQTGLLAENNAEWIAHIKLLIEDKKYREALGRSAFKNVWHSHQYNDDTMNYLLDIFI